MLKSNPMIFFVSDVPSAWIFEHYLNLGESLTGQSVKISSIFNAEKTPSMIIYYDNDNNYYMFKDFSSSNGGDGTELVSKMYGVTRKEAKDKIINDYIEYRKSGKGEDVFVARPMTSGAKYKVIGYEVRGWANTDAIYWKKYGIGSDLLNKYNVKPISSYTMQKTETSGAQESFTVEQLNTYGYFNEQMELCKIYQPSKTTKKFIKVKDYIQGSDQLSGAKYLVVCSSLKDVMTLVAMGFKNLDAIAPDSENSMLSKEYMDEMKSKYEKVVTLFDDDAAGIKSMMKYEEDFGVPYVRLQMSKDLSDSVHEYGMPSVKVVIYNLLKGVLR
jgi:DNA primase